MRERASLEHELSHLGLKSDRDSGSGYHHSLEMEHETPEEQARCKERFETFRKGLAQPVREALDNAKWNEAVGLAIVHNGIHDKYNLANMIYFEKYGPTRGYCKIKQGDSVSIKYYNDVLYNLVIPQVTSASRITKIKPEIVPSNMKTLEFRSDAELAVMKYIEDYAQKTIKQGHETAFSAFKVWFRNYEKAKESSTSNVMVGIFKWMFSKGLDLVFAGLPVATLGIDVFHKALNLIAQKALDIGEEMLKQYHIGGDINLFLDKLELAEKMVITQLLDAPTVLKDKYAAEVNQAIDKLVHLRIDNRWFASQKLPQSVKEILNSIGIGEPGSTTATQYAERWLKAHIYIILSQNSQLIQSLGSLGAVSVMAEVQALRQMNAFGNRERIFKVEQGLHYFFRKIVDINTETPSMLKRRLGISEDQADAIYQSRQRMGRFYNTRELVTRKLLSEEKYEEIKHLVVI